jgi:GNAT superfamily N-acetyltransferase
MPFHQHFPSEEAVDVRPGAQVRAAAPEDLGGLVGLCLAARAESTVGAELCTADAEVLRDQLGTLMAAPGSRILVGLFDDELVGLLLSRIVGPSPFSQEVSLHVEALYVGVDNRRRGLGHALLAGALAAAEGAAATQVYAVHLPGARGVQRFFARLGFAPAAAHRVVGTQTLQRRLAGDWVGVGVRRRGAARGLEGLIARRRQVRTEIQTGPLDLRDVQPVLAADPAVQSAGRASISRQVRRAVATRRDVESSTTIS